MARKAARHSIESGPGTAKTAEARTVKHGVSRVLPYVPPFLIWFSIMGMALTGWALWGGSPWYPVATWTAHLGAVGVSRRMTKHKPVSDVLVVLALATILGSGMLSVMVGVLGPTDALWSLWGGVGFSMVMYWTIRRMHLTGDIKAAETSVNSTVQKLLDSLNGAKPGNVIEHETGVIEIPVEVDRGRQDVEDLRQTVRDVESLTGLRPNAGKLVPSEEDAGRASMKFYPIDNLKTVKPWTGPSAFGESVAVAFPVAARIDYTTVNIYLTADMSVHRNAPQWLIMGMNGAGKSEFFRMLAADLLTRKDVTLWVHDHVKGLQTLKPVLEGVVAGGLQDMWVSMSLANGKAMLNAVRETIRMRARWLGAHDFDQWQEGCGLNALVVWLEEANDLGQIKDLIKLVKEGRSAGVFIFISLQRASHVALDTETRAQLSGNICFGVESTQDAMFGLSDYVRDRGAEPERWKNTKPGYAYIDAPGIEEAEAALEARTLLASKPDIIDAITRGSVVRRVLEDETDQVTVRAAGKAYADRLPVEAYLPGHPLFAKATGMDIQVRTDDELDKVDGDSSGGDALPGGDHGLGSDHGGPMVPRGEQAEEDVAEDDSTDEEDEASVVNDDLNREADWPQAPDVILKANPSKAVEELTKEECQARVQLHLMTAYRNGQRTIGVPDIVKMTPPIRFKREWIRNELNRLASGEADTLGFRLLPDDEAGAGNYAIVAPVTA